jgi:1,2-diacylglycerol-3-alpha-glucose alpha-1,2-galactosyltransferase
MYLKINSFLKRKDMLELRKELNIKEEDFVVLGVGQVQTRKGVLDFVEVAKNMPDVTFVWCGGFSFGMISDGYKELKEIYENPPKNVKFLGIIPREKMNDMYNMADLLFMPSFNELFPMSILEASNSHKPILLRNLELYEDILFKKYLHAEDVKGFINQITSLRTNKEVYKTSSNWSKEISEFYSKENVLEIWKKFYLSILKEKKD